MSSARASLTFIAPSAQRTSALLPRRSPVCVSRPQAASRSAFLPPFLPPIPHRSSLVSTLSPPAPSAPPSPSAVAPPTSRPTAITAAAAGNSVAEHDVSPLELEHSSSRAGRKHTAEARRKIANANRGNIPWNKGRPHSEETRRKIAENTKKAMMRPEMRRLLQRRATGRKHSEETKLKIRQAARNMRPSAHTRAKRRRPLRFVFPENVVKQLNLDIAKEIEHTFEREESNDRRFVVNAKRSLSEETRAKLSAKIKKLWADPQYRDRVSKGIQQRRKQMTKPSASSAPDPAEDAQTVSTKRRIRTSQSPSLPRTTSGAEDDDDDIVIRSEDLAGITMEDLGITGIEHAGIVTRPEPSTLASHPSDADDLYAFSFADPGSSVQPSTDYFAPPLTSPPAQLELTNELEHMDPMYQLTPETIHPSVQEPQPINTDWAEASVCNVPISPDVDTHVLDHTVPLSSEPDSLPLANAPLTESGSAFLIPSEQYDHLNEFSDATSNALMNPELVSSSWLKSSAEDGELLHSTLQSLDFLDVDSI
ncbi:hypothetical protein BWQ96_04611 [Gracilariopsis chorda]|uniref:Nuclease associated modular domain-containing protein n=1 Tax=Gracilariopsis chorda TaxID=448386 RepID=A0A2V3ITZ9_9FLOR|nr:hypothetical protein BWQ96_04611 [Gracilariopsis chorda]|eukprot:PXF45606.1 hypothetical protein BWQ96_04611 [Gracilariopsis chorda]